MIIFEPAPEPENGKIYYAEVKFCASGQFRFSSKIDFEQYKRNYPNTIFFIVSLKGIYEVSLDTFDKSGRINLNDKDDLLIEKNSVFNLRTGSILHFKKLLDAFVSDLPKRIKL
ncbi:hypothetical protein [Flavivirga aquimarina]|uniref:hypothetical protein n=1 Tax=Flavivirga aquimarina TaxID=2027862 RepID=UPI0026DFCC3E|nr:hypothetical protein [Flavivirga aquimarina]